MRHVLLILPALIMLAAVVFSLGFIGVIIYFIGYVFYALLTSYGSN